MSVEIIEIMPQVFFNRPLMLPLKMQLFLV